MKIKMLATSAGPDGTRAANTVHDVPDAEGTELVAGGYAQSLDAPAKPKGKLKGELKPETAPAGGTATGDGTGTGDTGDTGDTGGTSSENPPS